MKSLSYSILVGLCFFIHDALYAMQEEEFLVTHELFVDGGTSRANIGLLNYPQFGVYAYPYHMTTPLLAVHSEALANCMPSPILKSLMSIYQIADTPEAMQTTLFNKMMSHELNVAFLILKGLPDNPSIYNVVFHPIVAGWLGKTPMEGFNVPIQAAIFNPQGVQPAPSESIAFNALGDLAVNLHDRDNYSPNNGRFSVEAGRDIVSFWVMGTVGTRITIAFTLLAVHQKIQKELQEIIGNLSIFGAAQLELEQLIQGLERLAKQFEAEGKHADSNTLTDALQCLRMIYAKKFPTQVVSSPCAPSPRRKSIEAPKLPMPPVLKPTPSLSPDMQEELDLLHAQLLSLGYAIEQ